LAFVLVTSVEVK